MRAQVSGTRLSDETPWGGGTFGDVLLAPTTIYVRRLLSLMDRVAVKVRHCWAHHGKPHASKMPCRRNVSSIRASVD